MSSFKVNPNTGSLKKRYMYEDIYTEEDLEELYGKNVATVGMKEQITEKIKNACSCSRKKLIKVVNTVVPMSHWLPKYKITKNLFGDVTGGITVGIMHLPQGLAYSALASLPVITGLYVSFFPVLAYAIFASTRHISVGTFAVVSLMVADVIEKHVSTASCGSILDSSLQAGATSLYENITSETSTAAASSCEEEIDRRKIEIAIALSVSVAIIHFAMYLLRLGIVTVYLSSYMVSGFTCGAAFHVMTSQVPKLLGIDIPRKSGILSLIYTYIDLFSKITTINWATVIVSICCIIPLVAGKEINLRLKKKIRFPLPWELAVVIFSTVASQFAYLNLNYNVAVVGDIPQGIKTSIPSSADIGLVIADAIPVALVIYSVSISLSRLFAEKHAYEVDSNQELLAYSLANVVGSFFQCYPCASSLSRSLIWDETGGNTQLAGVISSVVILVILLWIGPLFETLPQAALAAIIVVNLKRLLLQFEQLKPLWKISKLDAVIWFVTWLAVVLLGVDLGLYVGLAFSLFTVVLRTQIVSGSTMVALGGNGIYRDSSRFSGDVDREVLIFKFSSPLIYANKDRFNNQLFSVLGFKPSMAIAQLEKDKSRTSTRRRIRPMLNQNGKSPVAHNYGYEEEENESSIAEERSRFNSMRRSSSRCSSYDTSSEHHKELEDPDIMEEQQPISMPRAVVIDMSACSFIDNDGIKALKALYKNFSKLNIRTALASCTDDVRQCLLASDFPSEKDKEEVDGSAIFFVSVVKAVDYVVASTEETGIDVVTKL